MDAQLIIYSIFYIIMSICVIYPPQEFLESGFTINNLFLYFLGSEFENFVSYHIKRISLNLIIYSLIPLGYIFFLIVLNNNEDTYFLWSEDNSLLWRLFSTTTIILPLASLYQILSWSYESWKSHPVSRNLLKFSPNWKPLAHDINAEYRSIHKIAIQSNAITKLIATENWIIKVSSLTFDICHHSDTTLFVVDSDVHEMSMQGTGQSQFITINVKTTRPNVADFTVRLNSNDFKDLEDRWGRAIPILPEVKFHKNITEKFIDAFKVIAKDNVRYSTDQELDLCIGCMQARANVKLQRNCTSQQENVAAQPSATSEACANCYCRPMWCCDCLGRWFATRQSPKEPSEWLKSKCTCPMCRATFCVLDVSLIEENIEVKDEIEDLNAERDGVDINEESIGAVNGDGQNLENEE